MALGVTTWAQGNLMVGDYGVLNGQDIDWSGHAWRNSYELALWILVPVVSVIFARRIASTAVFASRILIALQIVLLAYTAAQADPEARAKWEGPPEAIFELSSKQNVFHFVLDGFQSDAFHDILEAERAEIDRQYSGLHVLQEPHGRVSNHDRQHSRDADRTGVSQSGAHAQVHRQRIQARIDFQNDARPGFSGRCGVRLDLRQGVDDERTTGCRRPT